VNYQEVLKKIKLALKLNRKPKHKFPCEDCIVLAVGNCRELCDKVEMDNERVKTLFEIHMVCIDCGCKTLLEGPCGGLAQNVMCSNCGHKFNFGPPLFIHRIGVNNE
jgi:hypothetical protein